MSKVYCSLRYLHILEVCLRHVYTGYLGKKMDYLTEQTLLRALIFFFFYSISDTEEKVIINLLLLCKITDYLITATAL